MKFLCDNCKAKYQIPDEKIAGRTLRMKCRKCAHNIIIRGPKVESPIPARQSRRPASGRPRRGGSHAGPRPASRKSAIGAEFRRSAASVAPPAESPRPVAEWYVAINDVPVGPIKREEVARKIGTGAVSEDSLCWREGFDDWLPVSQVPELLALMKQRRVPKPPPRSAPAPAPAPPAPPRAAAPAPAPAAPKPRSNVVPIGGRLGAAAAPTIDEVAPAPAPAAVPTPAPAAAAKATPLPHPAVDPTPMPPPAAIPADDPFAAAPAAAASAPVVVQPRRLPVGAWIAIVGAGCFGIAFAIVLANKVLQDDPQPIAQNDPVVEATDVVDPQLDLTDPIVEDTVEDTVEDPVVEDTVEDPSTTTTTTMRRTNTTATTAMMTEPQLTDEQRRQLAQLQMSSGTEGTPGNIAVMMTDTTSMRAALDENAVRRVVQANQRGLQGCYNRAIRGLPDPPDSRLTVNVTVGASGSVTRLSVTGDDFGGLKACVTSQVRRWRFPPSSGSQQTRFPLVFTAPG